jgi:MoxR-like ATPase
MHDDVQTAEELAKTGRALVDEIQKRVIGQTDIVQHLLIALLARGHGLFVGVPGLAKTLLIHTVAQSLDLQFNRIQFTPDLMPSDITGTDILEQDSAGARQFRFIKGPIFCHLLLADEINRTPPKTQAALLQAMQEGRVTSGGRTYDLPQPFHVFATQNPIEQEGTYPLPEAQLDRFMMMVRVDYPRRADEVQVVRTTTTAGAAAMHRLLTPEKLLAYQSLVVRVPVADAILEHAVRLVRATRPSDPHATADIAASVSFGAGPRAAQHLILAAKARALLAGRTVVDRADVRALVLPVLRHRVLLNFHGESRKLTVDDLLTALLASLP